MQTTINNILEELHTSATRMLVLNSDNAMLISYFKNLNDNIVYLKELVDMDSKYNWIEIENIMNLLKDKDSELTDINVNFKIKEVTTEKKEAFLKIKVL
jgi:hypothetical protein